MQDDTAAKSYKHTLNLPTTDFPIRAQPAIEDSAMIERWERQNLFRASYEAHSGNPKYILHDGPPYSNGHIHLGHAYNKILKDIVSKSRRMMGYHVPVKPGWDCHGLPIELKVVSEKPGLSRDALIQACREYAQNWIDVQRAEFKSLGVLMDWDNPYITMSKKYEADTVRAFKVLVNHGFIERKNKTVPWCMSCETVLATAEIEYKERKDPSIYVAFDLKEGDAQRLFPTIKGKVSLLVWTTTPWTLPLNQAVLAKPAAQYVLISAGDRSIIVGAGVAEKIAGLLQTLEHSGPTGVIEEKFSAEKLKGLAVYHPFINKEVPILFDESVGTDEGTAFVHCAPGCGPLDYEIGVKNNLDIYSPITSDGRYSQLVEPKELAGTLVSDGQGWVIKKLMEMKTLIQKGSITHSYPHCWRCRNGLIFRATPQWFFDLERENIRQRVLKAIGEIQFIPQQGRSFITATVLSRWEWCLSRQRVWGTPIPALRCKGCENAFLDERVIDKAAAGIEEHGIEFWQRVPVADLAEGVVCPDCKGTSFEKEMDILDVWFESGISHFSVLYDNPELAYPADIYLEGVDQHRAWFQSSLIMSMVIEQEACMKTIMSHGYTVDAKGQKMSKSLGNVVAPDDIKKKIGLDGLRLWVASIGNESDPVVSDMLMQNVSEVHRKIRNTCRFLLSNLYDFDVNKDSIAPASLTPIDHYALTQLVGINETVLKAYMDADFTAVFHSLSQYCSVELSAYYLDIVKDRLYCDRVDGIARRSTQTVLWQILDTLTRLIAPILSCTAEQISDHYQKDKEGSIHLQTFTDPSKLREYASPSSTVLWPSIARIQMGSGFDLSLKMESDQREIANATQWETLKDIRSILLKALEVEREKGLIKHSLEAQMTAYIDFAKPEFAPLKDLFAHMRERGSEIDAFLKEFLIVSQFKLVADRHGLQHTSDPGIAVLVEHAAGNKCPRCWQFDDTLNSDHLCRRCERVLST